MIERSTYFPADPKARRHTWANRKIDAGPQDKPKILPTQGVAVALKSIASAGVECPFRAFTVLPSLHDSFVEFTLRDQTPVRRATHIPFIPFRPKNHKLLIPRLGKTHLPNLGDQHCVWVRGCDNVVRD